MESNLFLTLRIIKSMFSISSISERYMLNINFFLDTSICKLTASGSVLVNYVSTPLDKIIHDNVLLL